MPHAIWTGAITFGLVTIPVKLFSAVRDEEGIHFHFLHDKDQGRIKNVRTCEVDGAEVPWDQVVRGFEYEKGKYLVVTDEEIAKLRPEKTQAVEIQQFVELAEIEPMFFTTPYYLEPEKNGRHAYALLREALRRTTKVGIAQVVLRSRQYVAALKPSDDALVLQLMHYAKEIIPRTELELPPLKEKTPETEMKAALMLIDAMAQPFDASAFHDTFHDELRKLLEARAKGAPLPKGKGKAPRATNVIDLVAVLKKSLAGKPRGAPAVASPPKRAANARRRAS